MAAANKRVELLSNELFAAALVTNTDFLSARTRAALALDRILERDPELARLSQILSALHQARDAYATAGARREADASVFASA
jgi:hypothetical protein